MATARMVAGTAAPARPLAIHESNNIPAARNTDMGGDSSSVGEGNDTSGGGRMGRHPAARRPPFAASAGCCGFALVLAIEHGLELRMHTAHAIDHGLGPVEVLALAQLRPVGGR